MGGRISRWEEEDPTVDSYDDGHKGKYFKTINEGVLIRSYFDIEVDEAHQKEKENQSLHYVADWRQEDRNKGDWDFA